MENEKNQPVSGSKKKSGNFTQIPNEVILSQLSGNALKVYCYCKYRHGLKDRSGNRYWKFKIYDIQDHYGWSVRKIKDIFAELKQYNLIRTDNNNQYVLVEDEHIINQNKKPSKKGRYKRCNNMHGDGALLCTGKTEQKDEGCIIMHGGGALLCTAPDPVSLSENDDKSRGIKTVLSNTVTYGNIIDISQADSQCSQLNIVKKETRVDRKEAIKSLFKSIWEDFQSKPQLRKRINGMSNKKAKKSIYAFIARLYTDHNSISSYNLYRPVLRAHVFSVDLITKGDTSKYSELVVRLLNEKIEQHQSIAV